MAVPDTKVTLNDFHTALISVCQFMDKVSGSQAWDAALDAMDLNDEAFEEELNVIRAFIGYDPDDVMGDEDDDEDDQAEHCTRCDSAINSETGLCSDETCPFAQHTQDCPAGWTGHPVMGGAADLICTCCHGGDHVPSAR